MYGAKIHEISEIYFHIHGIYDIQLYDLRAQYS